MSAAEHPQDTSAEQKSAEPTDVGSSNWRSEVLRRAGQLSNELDAIAPETLTSAPQPLIAQLREHIAQAHGIAERTADPQTGRWLRALTRLRDWWTGAAVETAWEHLQAAREDLLLIGPSAAVRAQLPALARSAAKFSPDPAHDPQIAALRAITEADGELSTDQRQAISGLHKQVRTASTDHSEARAFRNLLVLWSAGLAMLSVLLAALNIEGVGISYALVGAGAGTLTTAIAWGSLTHLSGPYAVNIAQALLKVAAGAMSALLGTLLVKSGVISGLSAGGGAAYGYAVVFGLSQQALTQSVDSAAKRLG